MCSGTAAAAVPAALNLEGRLLAVAGGPAVDGAYAAKFALYASAVAQQPVWSEDATLKVSQGRFVHALGSVAPLPTALLSSGQATWLGMRIGNEPETSRAQLHQSLYALRGGTAGALSCSGCVGLSALKADGDLQMGSKTIHTAAVAGAAIQASSVTAQSFSGSGAGIVGAPVVTSGCASGKVVVGVDSDGKVQCADANLTGSDALEAISGGLLSTQFAKPIESATVPKAIGDNNPIGTVDEITVPSLGLAKKLSVTVKLENSNIADLQVLLYAPDNSLIVLHKGGPAGKQLEETWPVTAKPVSGDLGAWLGKNPQGKWRLRLVDGKASGVADDGKLVAWSVNILIASNNMVVSTGALAAAGGFQNQSSAGPPFACNEDALGHMYFNTNDKRLYYCDGEWRLILPEPLCGNGAINPGEECDDANVKDGDGCTAQCLKNVCGDGIVWTGKEECDDGNKQSGDGCSAVCVNEQHPQCKTYKTLNEAFRNVNQSGSGCDSNLDNSWYRLLPPAGTQMPTVATPINKCGTSSTGWMQGSHPAVKDGIVARKVCFHWSGNTCNWFANISVLNCVTYYIYRLPKAPQCNLRYCATN